MTDIEQGLKQISEIRSIMNRSSKFLSLSGLAGVVAGVIGLAGTWAAMRIMEGEREGMLASMIALGFGILLSALLASILLTIRQAKRKGLPLWTRAAELLVFSLFIPLVAGGVLCTALVLREAYELLPATMLLFYGLGLFSASQFTHSELRQLGYVQLGLGVLAAFLPEQGLLFWGAGFGVMHIVYGLLMHFNRDRHAVTGGS